MNRPFIVVFLWVMATTCGCDPQRTRKCEWYLEPDPKYKHLVEKGWVSLCVRNYEINRQKCFLSSKLEVAENIYGKPIRLSELKIEKGRKIHQVEACSPDE